LKTKINYTSKKIFNVNIPKFQIYLLGSPKLLIVRFYGRTLTTQSNKIRLIVFFLL